MGNSLLAVREINHKYIVVERNMTQEDFANIFHVTRQTVSNWENEKSYPDLQTLIRISNEFCVSLDTILKTNYVKSSDFCKKSQ